jgi:hypothetical protein
MVLKTNKHGLSWHEPPYTKAEEHEFYRSVNAGPMTILRSRPAAAAAGVAGA